jgi:hypothetical protein
MLRDQKGVALPTVLLIIVVLSLLGMMLLAVSANEAVRASYHEKKTKAYYIARSGADAIAQHIINNYTTFNNTDRTELNDHLNQDINEFGGVFRVQLDPLNPSSTNLTIRSMGRVNNTEDVVTLTLSEDNYKFPMKGIYATEPNASVNVGTNGELKVIPWGEAGVALRTKGTIIGNVVGPNQPNVALDPLPPSPSFPTTLDDKRFVAFDANISGYYGNRTINAGITYYITLDAGEHVQLLFDDLIIDQSSVTFFISGHPTGKVSIYANNIRSSGSLNFVNNYDNKAFLFIKGKLDLPSSGSVAMTKVLLYAPEAELNLEKGSFAYYGSYMIVKNITLNDQAASPGNKFSYEYMDGLSDTVTISPGYKRKQWGNK